MRIRPIVAATLACPVLVAAQTAPLTIRLAPAANQTLHTRIAQQTTFEIEPGGGASGTIAIPAMTFGMTMTMLATLDVGAADDQGRVEARVTYDDIKADMTMNGVPAPLPANPVAQLAGRAFTLVYDRDGRFVDFKADVWDASYDALKPMLSSMSNMLGATGSVTLAVGETVARPMTLALPFPNAGTPPGGLSTEMRFTLNEVTAEGSGRIAHLATAITGQMKQPLPGPVGAAMVMQMTGGGTLDVNVDRGFVKSSEQRMTLNATMDPPADGTAPVPPLRMHGTITISQSTEP
jgi:hypothetical protein